MVREKLAARPNDHEQVWALITARSGSKGMPDKNMQRIQGFSLIGLSAAAGKATANIHRVFISTDSEQYGSEALRHGAEVPFLRPGELARDDSTDLDVFTHFLEWAEKSNQTLPKAIVHLRPTTPLRDPCVIEKCVDEAVHHAEMATAVRSVHPATESPFKWFIRDREGFLTTLNGRRALDSANQARQKFEEVLVPNGYVDVIYPKHVLSTGLLHGDAVLPFVTEVVIEVDTKQELRILQEIGEIPPRLRICIRRLQDG